MASRKSYIGSFDDSVFTRTNRCNLQQASLGPCVRCTSSTPISSQRPWQPRHWTPSTNATVRACGSVRHETPRPPSPPTPGGKHPHSAQRCPPLPPRPLVSLEPPPPRQ